MQVLEIVSKPYPKKNPNPPAPVCLPILFSVRHPQALLFSVSSHLMWKKKITNSFSVHSTIVPLPDITSLSY